MEELKLLIEMVANLPALAMWVLVGYLVYKLVVIGSIYGVIRLLIERMHSWLTTEKIIKYSLKGTCIPNDIEPLLTEQIRRLQSGGYIFQVEVDQLREAIDYVIAKRK